ncbi:MAG: STAS domain-containing protein [Vicinamibacteria bacterium]|nr:STAS domain-containing protein [Vicinamibacteria bacterium]
MHVHKRYQDDVCVLDFAGSILLKEGGDELRDAVGALLYDGNKKLVLNLGRVGHMDSGGLGDIVLCRALAERQGGSLKLSNLTKGVKNILMITKLVTVFETYDLEEDAVNSFRISRLRDNAGCC